MNRIVFFFLLVIQVLNLPGQTKPYTEQEFEIRNVKVVSHTDKFNPDVQLDFVLATKYSLRDIETEGNSMFATYQVKFWIGGNNQEDSLTGIVYDRSYTMMSDVEGLFTNSTNITLTIPYFQFKKTGLQNCRIYCLASTESGELNYPVISSEPIKLNIYKTFPLSEQVITVSNLKISNPVNPQDGKIFNFTYRFKYNENELHPDPGDKASYNNRVYFFVKMYDAANDQVSLNSNILLNSEVVSQSKTAEGKFSFLVPYTDLNLEEGPANVRYVLYASTSDSNFTWTDLVKGNAILNVPQKYLTKIKLSNIGMHETQYDMAGQSIPLINIFMNQRKSSGKGYPDIYWSIGKSNRIIKTSRVSKNSFYFSDDSLLLQTLKDDKLIYEVFDDDFFGKDDLIGKYIIPLAVTNKKEFKKLSFGGIKSGNIGFVRRPFEKYFLDDLTIAPNKNGTFILKGRYSESRNIVLEGILMNGKDTIDLRDSIANDLNPEKDHFEFVIPGSVKLPFSVELILYDVELKINLVEKIVYSVQ